MQLTFIAAIKQLLLRQQLSLPPLLCEHDYHCITQFLLRSTNINVPVNRIDTIKNATIPYQL